MENLSTVNFDDLFDFSPEPLELSGDGYSGNTANAVASGGDNGNLQRTPSNNVFASYTPQEIKVKQEEEPRGEQQLYTEISFDAAFKTSGQLFSSSKSSAVSNVIPIASTATTITVIPVDDTRFGKVSSQSLPNAGSHWAAAASGGQQPQQQQGQQQQQSFFDFDTSVEQLLSTLPEEEELTSSQQLQAQQQLLGSSAPAGTSVTPAVVKGKRGRKPGQRNLKTDMKSKLERSRQSARECRARKKLRYQYLDDIILAREKANLKLKEELLTYQKWCHDLDNGVFPEGLSSMLEEKNTDSRRSI